MKAVFTLACAAFNLPGAKEYLAGGASSQGLKRGKTSGQAAGTGLGAEIHMGGYEDLMRTSERVFNIDTLFNRRAGVNGAKHTLPRRMLKEPMAWGAG